jgi:hypothetical protein
MRNAYFANLLISLMVLEVKQKARQTKMKDNRVESSASAGSPIFFLPCWFMMHLEDDGLKLGSNKNNNQKGNELCH